LADFREQAHELYNTLKKEPVPGAPEESPRTKAAKQYLIDKYEAWFFATAGSGVLRIVVVSYFFVLLFFSLMYIEFLGALWLRGLTPTPAMLASALGSAALPNLATMSFICSLGVLGQWHISATELPISAQVVVYLLNFVRIVASLVLISTFFGGYSADIARAENTATPS
jgi:hypothetical protein